MKLVLNALISDRSAQMLVRTRLKSVAARMGFPEIYKERILLVANELMSNHQKFSIGAGLLQVWESASPFPALDLFALDHGPGIPDVSLALQDGFSTAHTLGQGLGSIRRSADEFAIHSTPESRFSRRPWQGTAVWARFHSDARAREEARNRKGWRFGRFVRALHDNVYNGDVLKIRSEKNRLAWIHLDGLGHGREAGTVGDAIRDLPVTDVPPDAMLSLVDERLVGRRGACGICGVATPDKITLAGLGDLMVRRIPSDLPQPPPFPGGVLGQGGNRIRCQELPAGAGEGLLTASDGLASHWHWHEFPGLSGKHPQLAAFLLGNLLGRENDDKSLFILSCSKTDAMPPGTCGGHR